MTRYERIIVDPDIPVGKPIVKGPRTFVELIPDRVAEGWSTDDLLSACSHITREDIPAAQSLSAPCCLR
jgi:uncharacterized protein (DUF433 family)